MATLEKALKEQSLLCAHYANSFEAFILYRQYSQLDIDPNLSVPDASKVISDAWNSLSEKEKEPWKRLAEVC